jgi:glycosyltransferase involved in cell wall biosynthesis
MIDSLSKPKLKVAIISYYYKKPIISGVGIHARNLAKYLTIHNCEVHVFCNSDKDELYGEDGAFIHGIGGILTPEMNSFSKKRLEYDIFESEVIKEIIRENSKKGFDIVHTHGALTKAAFIIKKVYNIKWIHTFHAIEKLRAKELSNEEKQFEDLISWIEHTVNYSDGSIFVSKELSEEGKKHYTLKSKMIIPNGVDFKLFNYQPMTNKNVLFIGRFSKEKGVDFLPKLIDSIMKIENATFTIVCPYNSLGGELKQIRGYISRLEKKYKNRLKIIDKPQDQEALKELYKNCQVYIQPSKYESFGLCILEAMATGRPVVALNVGGIPEVIGDAGFTVKNTEELIYKVKELLNNRKECVSVGRNANKRAKNFDWEIIAQKIIKYYKDVKNV